MDHHFYIFGLSALNAKEKILYKKFFYLKFGIIYGHIQESMPYKTG